MQKCADSCTLVPVMALTATATENVKADVIANLSMRGCLALKQSFNRPNLTYEVREKMGSADTMDQIAELIQGKFKYQCGIIYCFSRKSCEKTAQKLSEQYSVRAAYYHAGMERLGESLPLPLAIYALQLLCGSIEPTMRPASPGQYSLSPDVG